MSRLRRGPRIALAGLAVALVLLLAAPALLRGWLRGQERNPVLDGYQLAEQLGCHGCHLPYGDEIPNPGSRWGSVPRFRAGNAFMYAPKREGIEEFIRFGAPRAWLDDPAIRQRLDGQLLRMPAYGDRLDDGQIAALVAYVCAVEGVDRPGGDAVAAGRRLAREHGCLSCHGVEGAGGIPNPGSLGGFIPGFQGRVFEHLVRDRDEFATWVRTGTLPRLEANPVARWYWNRQATAMPAYDEILDDDQIEQLWRWVLTVRGAPEATVETPPGD